MLVLLSPAKKMDYGPAKTGVAATQPRLMKDTAQLAGVTRKLKAQDLKDLMHISDDLANLNRERFKAFDRHNDSESLKAAALAFAGDVYVGLDAKSLSDDELTWAQDHIRILSGMYGALRPMDAIQPYRLEMGTKLKTRRGDTLYQFWGDRISKMLNTDLESADHKTVLNLASNEYFKAVDKKALDADIINVSFKDIKNGKARVLSFFAKQARGAMARWVVENRVTDPADLSGFKGMDYAIDNDASKPGALVFTRKQPPPVNG